MNLDERIKIEIPQAWFEASNKENNNNYHARLVALMENYQKVDTKAAKGYYIQEVFGTLADMREADISKPTRLAYYTIWRQIVRKDG